MAKGKTLKRISVSKIEGAKFDPRKKYKWTPENKFEFNGVEFAIVLNNLLKRKQEIAEEMEAINIVERKLVEAVNAGVAAEIKE